MQPVSREAAFVTCKSGVMAQHFLMRLCCRDRPPPKIPERCACITASSASWRSLFQCVCRDQLPSKSPELCAVCFTCNSSVMAQHVPTCSAADTIDMANESAALRRPPRLLLPGLAQHGMRLDAHALHSVHHHQRAVAQPRGRAHLAAEVHVAGRVDQIDQVAWRRMQAVPSGACQSCKGPDAAVCMCTAGGPLHSAEGGAPWLACTCSEHWHAA